MGLKLVMLGAGGHAASLMETAVACGAFSRIVFVDPEKAGETFMGCPVVSSAPDEHAGDGVRFFAAIGDNARRQRAVNELRNALPDARFAILRHPSSSVSSFAQIAPGAAIMQNAVAGAGARIGAHCIVNSAAIVEHDVVMEPFSSLAPGAVTGGGCRIGKRAAVCIGAVLRHGVNIGEDAILGANSYAHGDIPPRTTALGSPARVAGKREKGDPYL